MLNQFSTEQLLAEIERRQKEQASKNHIDNLNPIGNWEVTTEGDCEGKTVTKLGVFAGHIADIALALADKSYYSLHFSPSQEPPEYASKRSEVSIVLDIKCGTWDMAPAKRVATITKMLLRAPSKNDWTIADSQYFASVKLKKLL